MAETITLSGKPTSRKVPCRPSQPLPSTSGLSVKYVHGHDLLSLLVCLDDCEAPRSLYPCHLSRASFGTRLTPQESNTIPF
ncbi:hypothetical protein I79_023951 [Cricetulus griseus]|uniref:Uncharacterized protein n=1 Tax=Cricetulus griseus TaxID=10029 RepID=G3IJB8_CRIGR|nr:hypothetical protein I79_023951 [Cricetulus griseus]